MPGCTRSDTEAGHALARRHCVSCHQFPEPALLDKQTWKQGVLPMMALRLGVPTGMDSSLALQSVYFALHREKLLPDRPALTDAEWRQLEAYYLREAPAALPATATTRLPLTPLFAPKPVFHDPSLPPAVTCVAFDPPGRQFYVADNVRRQVIAVGAGGQVRGVFPQPAPVSHLQPVTLPGGATGTLITALGHRTDPGQHREGYLSLRSRDGDGTIREEKLLAGLHRPTQVIAADLDNDAQNEWITCEFGYLTGKLSWWRREGSGSYRERILASVPGALRVAATDANGDGWTDLIALFAQGDEQIVLFENQGNGTFRKQVLLQFPPSYGSSYFELADVDGDGRQDILYTCGDNADYSPVLKPYHGVYIFRNMGRGWFDQAFFQPMHGAYKAVARDFDADGDQDLVAVAFFADYRQHPEGSFLYLENRGKRTFRLATLDIHARGRWIALDAGDVDGDGDVDVLLGNCSVAGGATNPYGEGWQKGPIALLLENKTNAPQGNAPGTVLSHSARKGTSLLRIGVNP
jgi:hypothetical protein